MDRKVDQKDQKDQKDQRPGRPSATVIDGRAAPRPENSSQERCEEIARTTEPPRKTPREYFAAFVGEALRKNRNTEGRRKIGSCAIGSPQGQDRTPPPLGRVPPLPPGPPGPSRVFGILRGPETRTGTAFPPRGIPGPPGPRSPGGRGIQGGEGRVPGNPSLARNPRPSRGRGGKNRRGPGNLFSPILDFSSIPG